MTNPPPKSDPIREFGLAVLRILERDEGWSGDTLNDIDTEANNLGLTNDVGLFTVSDAYRKEVFGE